MNDRFGVLPHIVLGCLAVFAIAYGGFALSAYFSPKYEQVRRTTFEESEAYNRGVAQELESMQFAYVQAQPEHKVALRSIILRRAAGYDLARLPPSTRQFVLQLKGEVR